MINKIKNKYNKKGFISIYVILWMVVLFPLLMFISIDFTHFIHINNQLKDLTDNLSASAVTLLNEDEIPKGVLNIKENEANKIINKIVKNELKLNDDLTPTENSILISEPNIETKIVNEVPSSGISVTLKNGDTIKVKNPSVIVSADYPVHGLFFKNMIIHFNKIGTSQVRFLNK